MDGIINRPNKVKALQQFYQAPSHKLLYLRGPRDKAYMALFNLVVAVGTAGVLYGTVKMARGKK
jgi:hypothetical protein